MGLRRDDTCTEFEVPQDVELSSWIVVVKADESHEWGLVDVANPNVIDEPLAMACVDDLSFRWKAVDRRRRRAQGDLSRIKPSGLHDGHLKVGPCSGARVERIASADNPKLITSELAQQWGQTALQLVRELSDKSVLRSSNVADLAAEEATEIEETSA